MSTPGNSRILIASSLTKVHPGAGRSPGLVDLPVVRDPLGYPYIPGSSLKGALKTLLARRKNALSPSDGAINCRDNNSKLICCLLGGEIGEGPEGASAVSIGDLYPLLLPAPSPEAGIVYITTPYLIARAVAYLEAGGLRDEAKKLSDLLSKARENKAVSSLKVEGGLVHVGSEGLPLGDISPGEADVLDELAGDLNPLYDAVKPSGAVVIVPEKLGATLVSAALARLTRVRLDRVAKTVAGHALWTEEYLPWGTLFLGLIVDTGFRNRFCNSGKKLDPISELISLLDTEIFLVVGGKETVGGGLLKLKLEAGKAKA